MDNPGIAFPEPSGAPLPTATPTKSIISLTSFATLMKECNDEGLKPYQLVIKTMTGFSSGLSQDKPDDEEDLTVDLSGVPEEYHDFVDVFSKKKSDTLAPHHPYDLKIELESDQLPKLGPIYSLSDVEQKTLQDFIDENLATGFIRPSRSPIGAPVLFVKKKSGELRLCVDFRGLNKITRKDRYPLPLISDLLNVPRKAHIYI